MKLDGKRKERPRQKSVDIFFAFQELEKKEESKKGKKRKEVGIPRKTRKVDQR